MEKRKNMGKSSMRGWKGDICERKIQIKKMNSGGEKKYEKRGRKR